MKVLGKEASNFTNWTTYTPNVASYMSVGNGTISGIWRREFDSMRVRIKLTIGSTTAFGTDSQNTTFYTPVGYTVISTPGWECACGIWHYFTNGPTWTGWSGAVTVHSDNRLLLNAPNGQNRISGGNNPITLTYNSNGNYISLDVLVQISEFV